MEASALKSTGGAAAGRHQSAARRVRERIRRGLRSVVLKALVPRPILPGGMRATLMRRCGMQIGPGATIRSGCRIRYGRLTVGPGCYINFGVTFDDTASIVLEDNVVMAFESVIVTGSHEFGDGWRRAGPALPAPVRIGSGCWLGARVIVLPGVTIGRGCVIAAGSVVAHDCADDGLYAGTPGRRVRDL